jgi:hypothetical protein
VFFVLSASSSLKFCSIESSAWFGKNILVVLVGLV